MLAQEIESLADVRDAGFLRREPQTTVAQKLFDQWPDFRFQQLLGAAGNDEVIRVSDEIDLRDETNSINLLPNEALFQESLQSVQGHVRQSRRSDSALRRPRFGGKPSSFFHVASLQPLPKHLFIHRDILEHPVRTDLIETAFDVAF